MKKIEPIVKDLEGRIYLKKCIYDDFVEVTELVDKLNEVIEALNSLTKEK